jgi:hypothetical protein
MSKNNGEYRPSRAATRTLACDGSNPANFGPTTGRLLVHIGLTTPDTFSYSVGTQTSATNGVSVGAGFAPVVLERCVMGDAIDDNISVFAAAGKVACILEVLASD